MTSTTYPSLFPQYIMNKVFLKTSGNAARLIWFKLVKVILISKGKTIEIRVDLTQFEPAV